MSNLIQVLPEGALDIIGDVHGEYEALCALLKNLGYDTRKNGVHSDGRKMVFVGDLVDRGPDSPAVIKLVRRMIDAGNAYAVIGNHELNLLREKAKDGSGWYFDERQEKDRHYSPFKRVDNNDKEGLVEFISSLPVALERKDLRVVHAAWCKEQIDYLRQAECTGVVCCYEKFADGINKHINSTGLLDRYREEQNKWSEYLEDEVLKAPFLHDTAAYQVAHQMMNPVRVLTSGVERKTSIPFYASHKWRFVERVAWWNEYSDDVPVVVGHYWRKLVGDSTRNKDETNVFENVAPTSWHGAKGNVFCVDFSVGGRYSERNKNLPYGTEANLAALRWPERTLMLEDGAVLDTSCYLSCKNESSTALEL